MPLEDIHLSDYGDRSRFPSPVNRMMASFAASFRDGIDINLGVGYVNEKTIPGESISGAVREILRAPGKYRLPFNYGGPAGTANLLATLQAYLLNNRVGGLTSDILARNSIIIGPSGATSLLEGLAQVVGKGLVITTDPMYYIYCEYLERAGFEIMAVPEDAEGIRLDLVRESLSVLKERIHEIRFFYIVTVNNPSCTILSNARRRALVKLLSELSHTVGRKIPLILDRAYEDLIHDPDVPAPESALLHDPEGLVYEIGTLSKILAPALRIGYMVGKESPFLNAMVQKTSDTGFSAPVINQEIAGYMLEHHIAAQISRVNEGYRAKALAVRQWVETYLGPYLSDYRGGQAGFYYYLTFDKAETAEGSPFFRYLSRTTGDVSRDGPANARKERVLYLPGSFCVNRRGRMSETGKRQLRLSYGFEELDRIRSGILLMAEACRYAT